MVTIPSAVFRCFNSILDVLYPRNCVACGEQRLVGPLDLCPRCATDLPVVESSDPLYRRTRDRLCASGVIDDLVTVFVFEEDGPLQPVIHALKYQGMKRIGVALGREVSNALRLRGEEIPLTCAMPIPLHRARLRERGYNQASCLCQGVSRDLRIPIIEGVLVRQRYTSTQTALNAAQRVQNVRGAFAVRTGRHPALIHGAVLLMDDVITTGSTMLECAAALRGAGVAHVLAASVAIAR